MKTILLALTFLVSAGVAFGQGKISMLNDASRSIVWGGNLGPADIGLAGTAVTTNPTPSGVTLLVDLFGGPDAGSMTLQTTTTISAAAGLFGPYNFISPNLVGGTTCYMQVRVRDAAYTTVEAAASAGSFGGYSPVFTFRPSSTIAYNSIINQGGTALSTWAPGQIVVSRPVPEPGSLSFAGLAIGALLMARPRR